MINFNAVPPLTTGMIAAALLVGIVSYLGTHLGPIELLFFSWYRIESGELWRLVTPIFIHFGFMHLLFNGMATFVEGGLVEEHKGAGHMIGFVLVAAVLSNVTQFLMTGSGNFGGLSGVLYALFGYVWMQAAFNWRRPILMQQETVFILMGWYVLCWTGLLGPIANWAHTGGLVVGLVWGMAIAALDNGGSLSRRG